MEPLTSLVQTSLMLIDSSEVSESPILFRMATVSEASWWRIVLPILISPSPNQNLAKDDQNRGKLSKMSKNSNFLEEFGRIFTVVLEVDDPCENHVSAHHDVVSGFFIVPSYGQFRGVYL